MTAQTPSSSDKKTARLRRSRCPTDRMNRSPPFAPCILVSAAACSDDAVYFPSRPIRQPIPARATSPLTRSLTQKWIQTRPMQPSSTQRTSARSLTLSTRLNRTLSLRAAPPALSASMENPVRLTQKGVDSTQSASRSVPQQTRSMSVGVTGRSRAPTRSVQAPNLPTFSPTRINGRRYRGGLRPGRVRSLALLGDDHSF